MHKLAVLCVVNGGLFCVAGDVLCNLVGLCGVNGGLFSVAGDVLCKLAGLWVTVGEFCAMNVDMLYVVCWCLPLLVLSLSIDGGCRL